MIYTYWELIQTPAPDFPGLVDDFSIWNTKLTDDEVTELYSDGLIYDLRAHSKYNNVVAWFQFDDNAGHNRTLTSFGSNITLTQAPSPADFYTSHKSFKVR